MRKHIWIICIVVLAACVLLLLHHNPKQQVNNPSPPKVMLTNQQPAKIANPSTPSKTFSKQASNISNPGNTHPRPSPADKPNLRERVLTDWQAPIDFYGKVVDENTNPVAGANITFKWTETPSEDGNRTTITKSDADGLFSLNGARGPGLTVLVNKDGYYTSRSTPDSFHYALANEKFHPNPLNPVIFYLRKKGKGESLVEKNFPPGMGQIWQLHHDGTPIELDLLNGSQNVKGSGQLKLELWRDFSNPKANKFDWKLQISVLGGGLIPTDEEFPFLAPENSYQPSIVIGPSRTKIG